VFTTLEVSFEQIVIFFDLTNSSVTFQTIIKEILWNLINTGEVASFIDNVIVEIDDDEGHNKVVEVVKRFVENNSQKCKWKVREIIFLGVVIEPEEIKMEEEKVNTILDWLTFKRVKDAQKILGFANYYRWFIKNFAFITSPLHNLVKKDQK